MLEAGMKAPDFTLLDKNGDNVSLSDFLGAGIPARGCGSDSAGR